jgi:predicted  nucleic acid-binding Zn-ribbon protein
MSSAYDRMITMGYPHKCVCGAVWYDADGWPCHEQCDCCGEWVFYGELEESGSCAECVRDAIDGDTVEVSLDVIKSTFNSGVQI